MPPVITFGHQPCGFIPKRFLLSKVLTAKSLQRTLGGRIVFFYHDSDHDYRETITEVEDKETGKHVRLNFEQENKIQKKYSPLYLKRIPPGWQSHMAEKLHRYADEEFIEIFRSVEKTNVADFCLEIYERMGLLGDIEIMRSSDPDFRSRAMKLSEPYFVDVPYEGEIVRAKMDNEQLKLHRGGDQYIHLPPAVIDKTQISPHSSNRMEWMQSVIGATHYIMGGGEDQYIDRSGTPEVEFILRHEMEGLQLPILEPVEIP